MQPGLFINLTAHTKPEMLHVTDLFRLQRVERVHFADFDWARTKEVPAMTLWQTFSKLLAPLNPVIQRIRFWHIRFYMLMVPSFFQFVEGGGHIENLLAVLDRHNASRGKTAAISRAINFVDDRNAWIAGPQEIGMQRVTGPRFCIHGAIGRDQRLRDHLPAVDPRRGFTTRSGPAEKIGVQAFKIQEIKQNFGGISHRYRFPFTSRVAGNVR